MCLYYLYLCFFYCLAKFIILQGRAELYFFLEGIQEELFKKKNVAPCGFRAMIFKDQRLYFMGGTTKNYLQITHFGWGLEYLLIK